MLYTRIEASSSFLRTGCDMQRGGGASTPVWSYGEVHLSMLLSPANGDPGSTLILTGTAVLMSDC
jgi:hypothetical protein